MEKVVDGIGMAPSTPDSMSTMKRMARPSASPSPSKKPSTCMQNILWEG